MLGTNEQLHNQGIAQQENQSTGMLIIFHTDESCPWTNKH